MSQDKTSFRLAVVQPVAHRPPTDKANVGDAIAFIEQAAGLEARVVVFPESYPGPWRMPVTFDPVPFIAEAARRLNVYVQYGTLEPLDTELRTAHNLLVLAGAKGEIGRYRRTHPPGPWIYTGGPYWDFQYVPGEEYPVFETELGEFGMAMCSEVYVPEVTRALALRGAEVILLPAGIDKQRLWESWRNLIWSRAIENLAVVVTTQNMFSPSERGLAMVATPEGIVFETTRPGLFIVDIDLTRIRQLRAEEDGVDSAARNATKAGLLTQWQRPELYTKLHSRIRP